MAKQTLTTGKIREICESLAGQAEIAKFAQAMNSQGTTALFIDYEKVYNLTRRMVKDGILRDTEALNIFSVENMEKAFIEFMTEKMINYLSRVRDIEKRDASDGLPMLSELATQYLLKPMKPMTVFFWMSEYAVSFKTEFEQCVARYFVLVRDYDKWSAYKEIISDAIPMGINPNVRALSWVNANQEEYRKIDFSCLFADIDFDRYYAESFDGDPLTKSAVNMKGEDDPFKYVCKESFKFLVDEAFKPLVLDVVFPLAKSLDVPDINAAIKILLKDKPTLVYMLYSRAMFFAKASELKRIQGEFIKFFDKNNIKYEMVPKYQDIDPLMFKDMPWGSMPS